MKGKIALILAFVIVWLPCIPRNTVSAQLSMKIENFVITDASGNRITSLVPNGSFKAAVDVEMNTETEITMVLSVYKNNEMINTHVNRQKINGKGNIETIIPKLPSNTNGCTVRIFLWDNVYNMGKMGKAAVFPSDNAGLESVEIGGTVFMINDSMQTVFDIKVSPYLTDSYVAKAVTSDSAATYAVQYPEGIPGF